MSVGNLPAGAEVLIKIVYVTELAVDGDSIVFTLPATVAPNIQKSALSTVSLISVYSLFLFFFFFVFFSCFSFLIRFAYLQIFP